MTDLPDINVWLALADENHLHHRCPVVSFDSDFERFPKLEFLCL